MENVMNLSNIIIILLVFPGVASLLAFVPGLLGDLEILLFGFINEIFSILIIPVYLASVTVLIKRNIEISAWKGVLFIMAACSILVAVSIVYRNSASLLGALTGNDLITKTVAIIVLLLANIMYFISYVIVARIIR